MTWFLSDTPRSAIKADRSEEPESSILQSSALNSYDKVMRRRCRGLAVLQKQSTAEKIGAGGNQQYKPTLIQVVPWRGWSQMA